MMRKIIKVKARKYEYTLEQIKSNDDRVGGCYGCFFCKLRDGYYRQVCGSYSNVNEISCGSIWNKSQKIFKLISKRKIDELTNIPISPTT